MGLEDIPEMQVIEKVEDPEIIYYLSPVDFTTKPIDFKGKFVVLRHAKGEKEYILALRDAGFHDEPLGAFISIVMEKYGIEGGDEREFLKGSISPLSGGDLEIDDFVFRMSGESGKYGKYDKNQVRPIVEEWVRENLSNHRIEFD